MDYTAAGQTTHLAARMEQLALPGTIRVTADTLRLAEGFVQGRSLGACPVKGLEDSVEPVRVGGRHAAEDPLPSDCDAWLHTLRGSAT